MPPAAGFSRTLYVSIVGFILVKRTIQIAAGQSLDVTIILSEGTGTYSETVVVSAGRFREQEKAVPSQQVLGSADIQNLRSLVTNDPMRTIQVLPGVSTGDDFRSEFAVRGSPFSRIAFTLDGIPAPFLLHTVQQVQDGGSIAMVNGDILDSISLMNGSYPQRYGNRLGAELDFHMREGSRDRRQVRAGVSGTDASFVAEGPLGADKSGSWLISVRKSYLEYLLKRVSEDDDDFGFGFYDAQAKFVKDVSSRHRVELAFVAGRSRLDQQSEFSNTEEVTDGRNVAELLNVGWRFTPSASFALTQRFAVAANQFANMNPDGIRLGEGGGRDVTWRADFTAERSPSLSIEGGGQVQWLQRRDARGRSDVSPMTFYDGSTTHTSGYAQVLWSPTPRFTVIPGARVDRWSLTSGAGVSPWLQFAWKLTPSFTLRAGTGIHRQFPGIDVVTGRFGNPELTPERAVHADLGIEQVFGNSRWQLTFYDREERDVLRRDFDEFQLVVFSDGSFLVQHPGEGGPVRWFNRLDGHARGVELLVQRRSTSGLSGWLAYSYGVNRYTGKQLSGAWVLGATGRPVFPQCPAEQVASADLLAARRAREPDVSSAGQATDALC